MPAEPTPPLSEESLVSTSTAAQAVGALSGLQMAMRDRDGGSGFALGNGGLTLEQMVREELRPILKAWLDQNLPGVVERLVEKEIRRLSRQADQG